MKEWGSVVHALLDGRQTILLRKGGIRERSFAVRGTTFVLYPTVEHSHHHRVRPQYADLLARGAADVAHDRRTLRCRVQLIEVVTVAHPDGLRELGDLHIYGEEHVEERLAFRPRHPLHVLVAQAAALRPPVTIRTEEEHGGCSSWVDLALHWDGNAETPVLTLAELDAVAQRVRSAV
ncbi:MAG: DUF1802 family protein [Nitriliruptorales bacterium]